MRTTVVAATLLLFGIGCTSKQRTGTSDLRGAALKAVQDREAAVLQALAAKDVDKIMTFEGDYVAIAGLPIFTNRDSLRAGWKAVFADPNYALNDLQVVKTDASADGDFAYSLVTASFTVTDPKTKKPTTEHGKELLVLEKKPDGSWKVAARMAEE